MSKRKLARKILVLLVGLPLLVLGIILIPLPGPGVLVCLLAFFVLSLEFEWASKHFERFKLELKKIYDKSKERQRKFEEKHKL